MGLTRPRAYQIYNLDYKQSVRVVTVSNVTLSGGAPASVDGVSLSLNDRVLVTGQSTGSQNGLYYVTTVGTGSNGTWQRSIDGNETGEIEAGLIVMVTEGSEYADTQWKLTTNDPIVVGTTSLNFVPNAQGNSISAGTSNVVVNANANVTISSAGTANVLTVSSTGASVTGNIDSSGAVNINSTLGNYNVLNISGTALGPYGTPQTWKFFTNNTAVGGVGSWILFPDNSTQFTAYPGTTSTLSLSGNITGGNLTTTGKLSVGLVQSDMIPATDITYSLGNATNRWSNLYLSGNTIYLGNSIITENAQGDVIIENSGSFAVPAGNTAQRSAVLGALRFNTDFEGLETYNGTNWYLVALDGQSNFPEGDYGLVTQSTTDAFGVTTVDEFDCNAQGPLLESDLGTLA